MGARFKAEVRVCLVALFVLFLHLPLSAQRGAITLPQNLNELVAEAGVIVRGQVLSARVEPHPDLKGLSTVVVTLRVDETLKGNPGPIFTFRQFIWDVRDRYDIVGYRKGQHLLLLMVRPSAYGLSSPVGLEQGRFRILRDGTGKQIAANGHNNAGLFRELAPQLKSKGVRLSPRLAKTVMQPTPGPIELEDLRELIRQIVGAN
jgi:hypothetical protein